MAEFVELSRRVEALVKDSSNDPRGPEPVGEGRTSDKRDGGPLDGSLFQMLLPHGDDVLLECVRPEADCCEVHELASPADPNPCELVEESDVLPSKGFLV
jgi:hypothetical protein